MIELPCQVKLESPSTPGKGVASGSLDGSAGLRQSALAGEKLLQELLPTSQLRDAVRELVHALLEIARPACRAVQQAVFEAAQAAPGARPGRPEQEGASDGSAEGPEEKQLFHVIGPAGNPGSYGPCHHEFRDGNRRIQVAI